MGLQKVGRDNSLRNNTFSVRDCSKHLLHSIFSRQKLDDSRDIPTTVTVVGSTPYSDEFLVEHELESFMHELVSSADQLEIVHVHELMEFGNTIR